MLTARQLKIIKLIMNNPGIHGKEISENLRLNRYIGDLLIYSTLMVSI